MTFCINCGQELPDGAKFCPNCGAPNTASPAGSAQRKTEYEGTVHKCPVCGEIVDSFTLNCPSCGHEFRDSRTTNSVKELALQIEAIENRKGKMKLRHQIWGTYSKEDAQQMSLIRNFSIPNTKEDIMEFTILASSNINVDAYSYREIQNKAPQKMSDAWLAKLEQAYQKAQLMFGESQEFLNIKSLYFEKVGAIKHMKFKRSIIVMCSIVFPLALFIMIMFFCFKVI